MSTSERRVRAGVLGATGYTGQELVRLLARHPAVELAFATSESEAGTALRKVVASAPALTMVPAEEAPLGEVDVVFSCLPHGASMTWVERVRAAGARAVDLSNDLRVPGPQTPAWAEGVVYGLPELHRARLAGAELVANPGCYPTGAILSIAPLARRGLIAGPVIIDAASGVSGAGRTAKREYLFAEVAEDFRAYAVGNVHRHLAEMRAQIAAQASGSAPELVFTPHLLPVRAGILETIYVPLSEPLSADEGRRVYLEDYGDEPFVDVLAEGTPALRDVVGTNRVAIGVEGVAGLSAPMLLVVAAVDNLVKGAAGQAVQNMNLMFGLPEAQGLA